MTARAQVDPTSEVERYAAKYWKNATISSHVFGDAAADIVLTAMEKAYAAQGPTAKRHSLQHATLVRPDQWARIKKLNMFVSFTAGTLEEAGEGFGYLFAREVGGRRGVRAQGGRALGARAGAACGGGRGGACGARCMSPA